MPDKVWEAADNEDAAFLAICQGRLEPDQALLRVGYDAHAAGKQFHEGPRPIHTVEALCWRLGWNARALEQP